MDTETKRDSRDHYEGGGTTTPRDANPQISRRTHTGSTTHIQQDPTVQGTPLDTSAMTILEQELIPGTPQAHPNNVQTTIRGKRGTPITGNTTHNTPVPPMIMIGSSEDNSDNDVVEMTAQDDQRGTPLDTSTTSRGNNNPNLGKTHPHPYTKGRETNLQIIHTNTGTNKQKHPIQSTSGHLPQDTIMNTSCKWGNKGNPSPEVSILEPKPIHGTPKHVPITSKPQS